MIARLLLWLRPARPAGEPRSFEREVERFLRERGLSPFAAEHWQS